MNEEVHKVLQPGELGARIKYWRTRAKLRNKDIAKALKVSKSSVSLWESGGAQPNHETLAQLARLCGVGLPEFWAAPIICVSVRND